MKSEVVCFFLICTKLCVGSDSTFLDHLLTRQQKDVTDYIPASKWSIFDVFGAGISDHTDEKSQKNDQKGTSHQTKSRSGWKKPKPQTFTLETPKIDIPLHKSAAAIGGLLPTKIFVLNSDRLFERWLSFRDRWALVNGHSGNFSVADSSNPIRFRGADLGLTEEGKLSMSWKRKLDVLPPRTRKTALECRDVALSSGHSDALGYGLSHLALWESIAMDKKLKMDDRILILDDTARPRQHWIDALNRVATGVPRDWDLISLGWFGGSRKSDEVGDGSAFRVNPPFWERGDHGKWDYFYGGAHARLVKGRVVKRMVVALSKLVKPPQCALFWPDQHVLEWANHTGVNYYALKQPLFGLVEGVGGDFEKWVDHAVEGPASLAQSTSESTSDGTTTDTSVPDIKDVAWSRGRSRYDVSSASRKKIRARLPPSVKCRTIVSQSGIEREVCA